MVELKVEHGGMGVQSARPKNCLVCMKECSVYYISNGKKEYDRTKKKTGQQVLQE